MVEMLGRTVCSRDITLPNEYANRKSVRVAAKELTSLILDEERLRAERSDRKSWKSRVTGLEETAPQHAGPSQRPARERRRQSNDPEDAEYRLALEASRYQEEEDRKRRAGQFSNDDDDDLAKAIKLSKEEEERRRRELEESNAMSLFDDTPAQQPQPQPQFTGFNQGYQQGSAVDFFANPIEQAQQTQPTGFIGNTVTGYPHQYQQATGFSNNFGGFGAQPMDPFGQQQQQPQQLQPVQSFQSQPTAFQGQTTSNVFQSQQGQALGHQSPFAQPGSNNPWNTQQSQSPVSSLPTGSNNPFASSFGKPPTQKASTMSTLGSLPEQKTLASFNQAPSGFSVPSSHPSSFPASPQKELNEHEAKLNALLAGGDGMDTFGNTGHLRIPAQHTAPGTFVNSAGAGASRLTADATGSNPFLRSQFTGMPNASYSANHIAPSATGAPGMNGMPNQGYNNNPFAARTVPQNGSQQDLIQF